MNTNKVDRITETNGAIAGIQNSLLFFFPCFPYQQNILINHSKKEDLCFIVIALENAYNESGKHKET